MMTTALFGTMIYLTTAGSGVAIMGFGIGQPGPVVGECGVGGSTCTDGGVVVADGNGGGTEVAAVEGKETDVDIDKALAPT